MSSAKSIKAKTKNTNIYMLKIKTESNNLGMRKTVLVLGLILIQLLLLILSYTYFLTAIRYYSVVAGILSIISCIHVLSSASNGQTKATWVLFLLACYSFGYIFYLLSNEYFLFGKSRKKYQKIYKKCESITNNNKITQINNNLIKCSNPLNFSACEYLKNYAYAYKNANSKINYFSNGSELFDEILNKLKCAKKFIFMEYYIISEGVLLKRFLDVLKLKSSEGVDVRIIYDDMGSHGKIKRKTKKQIKQAGIKLMHFNRLVPIFDLALNLRDHRKIIVVDGKVAFTGGANLADEYINEKQIYGYWKDSGVMVEGPSVENFTLAFLRQWEYLTKQDIDYSAYLNLADIYETESIVVPFISGPEFKYSISKDMYTNLISSSAKVLNIMTPYFIPEETVTNLLITKAKSGVTVNLVLPEIADKKFVYVVSRDYAERLISSGVNIFVMKNSFVHAKVISNENSAIVGSINVDHRSFNQQFESAVYTNDKNTLKQIDTDFEYTIKNSEKITAEKRKRNNIIYRIFAGLFRLISPFM